ncbi:phosphatidylglycerol:prolipoprotein diacylglycerol transferase [Abditibacterium utsteinense]|uniref:Phosphatidylglycerol:prolipoprotein diacylglycerol transferase n=1 Tax=Abditibacterium utsteinense TaxID=1960156 RepID=A0A2S8SUP8_9BACT|nr:prolipoprotein diacylglyceryl transferase family protein [Abditibacterium utsteinense]PQV64514.1 phosphatidylglycerol:prolipoprotein diacylglycerol transferase [Abditibacterium utsteinense]
MTSGEFFTFLGYLTGALVLYFEARRRHLATVGLRIVALCGVVGGVLGARLSQWILESSNILAAHPLAFLDPRNGGKSLVGGLIFGYLSVAITKRCLGIRRSTGDLWALALPAGEAVGRIGCVLNGCCYGTPFSGAWAIFQHGAWRHPTQIYSALAAALIFAILLKLRDKLPREGDLFRLYLALYGVSRFGIEGFRERHFVFGALSMVQLICLETAIFAMIALWLSSRNPQKMKEISVS